jgi:endonuclease G
MLRNFLAIIILFSFTSFTDSSLHKITHKYYTVTYSSRLNYPVRVEYWLTRNMHVCQTRVKRTDDFRKDPQLENTDLGLSYRASGYDRGHNFPAHDASCDKVGMSESFFYTNMTPQKPGLNRGAWKVLEEKVREKSNTYDSIYVVMGSIQGSSQTKIGGAGCPVVFIPTKCWKAIWVKKTGEKLAFIFPNDKTWADSMSKYTVSLQILEKEVGRIFPN